MDLSICGEVLILGRHNGEAICNAAQSSVFRVSADVDENWTVAYIKTHWRPLECATGRTKIPRKMRQATKKIHDDFQVSLKLHKLRVCKNGDDGRHYQWNAELSTAGVNWQTVADVSRNTQIASEAGYTAKFPPITARYVRITMLKSSANPYVHIVELIVNKSP